MRVDIDTSSRPPVTVADLIKVVSQDPGIDEPRRRVVLSALRRFCEVIGKAPGRVVLDAALLRATLTKQQVAKYRFSRAHWQNILCHVRWAGRRAGLDWIPGRNMTPMSPAWARLYELAPNEERRRLSKLFRYCSQRSLEPEQVDDAVIATYWEKLSESSLAKDPYTAFRHAAVLWNRMGSEHDTWPDYRFVIEDRSRRRNLPWDAFPASLKESVEDWARSVSGDIAAFEQGDDFVVLKPRTIKGRKHQILTLASAAVRTGIAPKEIASLRDLVHPDVYKAGLLRLHEEFGGMTTPWLSNIARGIPPIAEHYLRLPEDQLVELKRLRKRTRLKTKGLNQKNRDRLRPLKDPRNLERLLWLADRVFARTAKIGFPTKRDAIQVQLALAVEIFLYAPMRIGNLTRLDTERHFRWTGTGRARELSIVIPAEEVKNEVDLDFPLPKELLRKIELYLAKYHPLIAPNGSPWLFPGLDSARHKAQAGFGGQISDLVLDETGMEIHPHLFRHIAAMLHLLRHPGQHGIVQQNLGHKDINSTITFYACFETESAIQHYQNGVLDLKANRGMRR